jgi:superfamily II DNA helicase RecQ
MADEDYGNIDFDSMFAAAEKESARRSSISSANVALDLANSPEPQTRGYEFNNFSQPRMNVQYDLKSLLSQYFGFHEFRHAQERVILEILAGRDVAIFWSTGIYSF